MREVKKHPTASLVMMKLVISGVLSAFILMFLIVYLNNNGYKPLAGVSAFVFIIDIIAIFIGSQLIVRRAKCPNCNSVCKSSKDEETKEWLANCETCNVTWRLGIGSRNQGGSI